MILVLKLYIVSKPIELELVYMNFQQPSYTLFLVVVYVWQSRNETVEGFKDSSVERRSISSHNIDDPMIIQNSDNLGMSLVTVPLTDSNYLI